MADSMATPLFPPPTGFLFPSSRHHRSCSGSPARQRPTDELLSNLTPTTALDAFRNPSKPLKICFDAATVSEQSFAMRAALASKNIKEWLAELSSWPWPSNGLGSNGFDSSIARSRGRSSTIDQDGTPEKAVARETIVGDKSWLGCLRASDVARYERRLAEIQEDLDGLDIDGIKNHVLHHHILPLSRPGTPMSESNRSVAGSTVSQYNRMDDMTALITATVVQTLPNLSRLTRLMNTWTIRLLVLRRAPMTAQALDDAERALRSGWNAIGHKSAVISTEKPTPLSRHDFEVMKGVLGQQIAKAAQSVDFLLDKLEGTSETIPSEWADRMDNMEKSYGSWVSICERMMMQPEWATATHPEVKTLQPAPILESKEEAAERPGSSSSDMTTIFNDTSDDQSSVPRIRTRHGLLLASEMSPPSSPPSVTRSSRARSMSFSDIPPVLEEDEDVISGTPCRTPLESSFPEEDTQPGTPRREPDRLDNRDQLQKQISSILESIPAKIHLSSQPQPTPANHLNPPDLQLPHLKHKGSINFDRFDRTSTPRNQTRSYSSMSSRSSRAGTPSFLLAPAAARNTRSRAAQREIQVYHLTRPSSNDVPIKLFIRLVGEQGERVMVRVGGGWADLGEYLKEYASHHGRRKTAKVEVKDANLTSSPGSCPDSPITPINVRKTRRSLGGSLEDTASLMGRHPLPKTPLAALSSASTAQADSQIQTPPVQETPSSETSTRSRSSSRLSWVEEDSLLGMSGPTSKQIELDRESKKWVETVKERVRIASGERRIPPVGGNGSPGDHLFGEISRVGGTKRLFRKAG